MSSGVAKTVAEHIWKTSARIFGKYHGSTATGERSARKMLSKPLVGAKIADYYPVDDFRKADPYFQDPSDVYKKRKLESLKRRGKGPPPKGQGKRASKAKK